MKKSASHSFLITILSFIFLYAEGKTKGHTQIDAVTTVREAILMASPHDTVFLENKTYLEHHLLIDKPLTLVGAPKTIIDAEENGWIIKITSDSVNISNITLANVGISHTKDQAAIHVSKVGHFQIKNVKLINAFFGILVEKSSKGQIISNHIKGTGKTEFYSGNGIHLWHCENIIVSHNNVSGMRDGIYFEFVTNSSIHDNVSQNNVRYGLHFMFSNNDQYHNNTFTDNGAGVAVMFSKFIEMKNNTFQDNWGPSSFGLLLKEIYDAEIENNLFSRNTVAIHVDGSSRINYLQNKFHLNGWGIKVTGGCYENIFQHNDFVSNSFDLSYNSKLNDNEFKENYWSEYNGYDLDKDGNGDVPYRPVSLFSYIVNKTPESIVMLRSLFVELVNFSEKVSPVFTPDNLLDPTPKMKPNDDQD